MNYTNVGDFGTINPEIYKNNPFRIFDLPFDASNNDINKGFNELKIKLHQNNSIEHLNSIIPIVIAPDDELPNEDTIKKARDYLDDPKTKFIYEFFWFWPMNIKNSERDEAIDWLEKDPFEARKIWAESDGNIIATHNLAVLEHIFALDNEFTSAKRKPDRYWKNAYDMWNSLFSSNEMLPLIKKRIEMLQNPLIKPSYADNFYSTLPEALLSINAGFIAQSVEEGKSTGINRHKKIIENSGFQDDLIKKVLQNSIEPARNKIDLLISSSEKAVDKNPEDTIKIVKNLIRDVKPILNSINEVLPSDNVFSKNLHEKTAKSINISVNMLSRTLEGKSPSEIEKLFTDSLKLLETAIMFAVNESTHQEIENNINSLRDAIELQEQQKDMVPLKRIVDEVDDELKKNPEKAINIIEKEMGNIESLLNSITQNFSDTETLNKIKDNVAMVIFDAAITYFNQSQNNPNQMGMVVEKSLKYLNKSLEIASSEDAKKRIRDNIGVIKDAGTKFDQEKDLIPLMEIVNSIDDELQRNPKNALNTLEKEIGRIESLLDSLSHNFPDKENLKNIKDNVAMMIFGVSVSYFNSLQEAPPADVKSAIDKSLKYLDISMGIATSNNSKKQIKDNKKVIERAREDIQQGKDMDSLGKIISEINNKLSPKDAFDLLSREMGNIKSLLSNIDKKVSDKKLKNQIHDNVALVIMGVVISYLNSMEGSPQYKIESTFDQSSPYLVDASNIAATKSVKNQISDASKPVFEAHLRMKGLDPATNPQMASKQSSGSSVWGYFSLLFYLILFIMIIYGIGSYVWGLFN